MRRKRQGLQLDIVESTSLKRQRVQSSQTKASGTVTSTDSAEAAANTTTTAPSGAGCLSPTASLVSNPLSDHLRSVCSLEDASKLPPTRIGSRFLVLDGDDSDSRADNQSQQTRNTSVNQAFKVLDLHDNKAKFLLPLSVPQYHHFLNVSGRLSTEPLSLLPTDDAVNTDRVKNNILPDGTEIISEPLPQRLRDNYPFLQSIGRNLAATPLLLSPIHHGDLHSFVREQKRLKESLIRSLFYQIVQLTSYCHQRGILVRDLKLRKFVFADKEKTIIRLDTVDDLYLCPNPYDDSVNDRHGCPAYVSPELLALDQASYAGKPADMWSLGVLLFVVSLGRYPFYDSTPSGLFSRIRAGTYCIPSGSGFSPELLALIRSLLWQSPSERPTAHELLAYPWLLQQSCPGLKKTRGAMTHVGHVSTRRWHVHGNDSGVPDDSTTDDTGCSSGTSSKLDEEDWIVPDVEVDNDVSS